MTSNPVGHGTVDSDTGVSSLIGSDPTGNAGETGDPEEREEEVVDENANRLFTCDDIFGGTLPKQTYEKLLTSEFSVQGCLNVLKVLIKYMVKKKKLNLNDIEVEAESWHILVRSSQKYYPPKKRKGILEKEKYGIRLAVFRIDIRC